MNPNSLPVAVDAMGGDNAPSEIIKGAELAVEAGIPVLLVAVSYTHLTLPTSDLV